MNKKSVAFFKNQRTEAIKTSTNKSFFPHPIIVKLVDLYINIFYIPTYCLSNAIEIISLSLTLVVLTLVHNFQLR